MPSARPAALLLLAGLAACASARLPPRAPAADDDRPVNVIYFITDGFGPASVTFARDFKRSQTGQTGLAFDSSLVGALQTWATNTRVTDSAAGGTALAAGVKTYNGAIAVDTLGRAVATVLEAAQARGMGTGVVVTSRITHATPACFTAHADSRALETEIALQQVHLAPDVFFGGGRRYFVPTSTGGLRPDGKALLDTLRAKGYGVALNRAAFDGLDRTPAAALLADDHLAYEIDRDPAREPSLAEMTTKAIELLRGHRNGFFLMVEASRIDHAGHANDAAAHVRDILAFEAAWRAAVQFAREDGHTLVVSTSDHETGGLSVGRDGLYAWHPEVLARVQASHERLAPRLLAAMPADPSGAEAMRLARAGLGLDSLAGPARARLLETLRMPAGTAQNAALGRLLRDLVSVPALVGWTTLGHTAVDVNVYAFGPGADHFRGNHPNDFMGQTVARVLGLDLAPLTAELRRRFAAQARAAGQ